MRGRKGAGEIGGNIREREGGRKRERGTKGRKGGEREGVGEERSEKRREEIYLWTIESSVTRIKVPFLFTITLI